MKKNYVRPCILDVKVEAGTCFMVNSLGGASHEGFIDSTDPSLELEEENDEDSPY